MVQDLQPTCDEERVGVFSKPGAFLGGFGLLCSECCEVGDQIAVAVGYEEHVLYSCTAAVTGVNDDSLQEAFFNPQQIRNDVAFQEPLFRKGGG